MKAVFLSDAHLKCSQDPGYRALIAFLSRLRGSREETGKQAHESGLSSIFVTDLFLVGDMFDFWFSKNGRIYPDFEAFIDCLKSLKARGIAVHLCEGNHDFFLRGYFFDQLGMRVYEDWAFIEPDGQKLLVAHGDLVDRSNKSYLKLRKLLRSSVVFQLQRRLPLALLWGIARWCSSMSKELMNGAEERIAGVMRRFAQDRYAEGFDAVILGHCHKPQMEECIVDGKLRVFVTLGDWVRHHTYLYYDEGRFFFNDEKE